MQGKNKYLYIYFTHRKRPGRIQDLRHEKEKLLIACPFQTDADKGNMPSIIQTIHRNSDKVMFSTVFHAHNRNEKASWSSMKFCMYY